MNHITDEQFEDILQGEETDLTHLRQCQDCRDRLAEKKAIAERLRLAFSTMQASPDLADRISHKLNTNTCWNSSAGFCPDTCVSFKLYLLLLTNLCGTMCSEQWLLVILQDDHRRDLMHDSVRQVRRRARQVKNRGKWRRA